MKALKLLVTGRNEEKERSFCVCVCVFTKELRIAMREFCIQER